MKNTVVLKMFSSGISVIMDESIPFEELVSDVAKKFKENEDFFKNAAFAISLEGRQLTIEEEKMILDAITENSKINVLCLMGKDDEKNIRFTGVKNNLTFGQDENCGQFYRGSLKNGESIDTENSIVILGDVEKGCAVNSTKDIVILGNLMGSCWAGSNGNNNHFVVALSMEPESLKIGNLKFKDMPQKKSSLFNFGAKTEPAKLCYITNNEIKVEAISSSLLESFTL